MDIRCVDMDIFCEYHYLGFSFLALGYHVLFNLAVAPLCWIGVCVLLLLLLLLSLLLFMKGFQTKLVRLYTDSDYD